MLVKDKFEMKVKEGKLELTEYAGSIGHNFCVTLNGKTLGTILDNLDLKMENIVFDNAVIIAYEEISSAACGNGGDGGTRTCTGSQLGGVNERKSKDKKSGVYRSDVVYSGKCSFGMQKI